MGAKREPDLTLLALAALEAILRDLEEEDKKEES